MTNLTQNRHLLAAQKLPFRIYGLPSSGFDTDPLAE